MHPYPHLHIFLTQLGILEKPRFSLEETAEILGIRRDQVLDLLKRGKLIGKRASERRWSGILADDLDDYLEMVNTPKEKRRSQISSSAAAVVTDAIPAPPPPSMLPRTPIPPPIPSAPRIPDPCCAPLIDDTQHLFSTLKPKLSF